MARDRILLVDDEPNILGSLRRALELEEYRVDVAGDGEAALAKILDARYDAVVLDVAMPGKNGVEVLREIVGAQPGLPVLMMSGNATLEIAVEAVRIGAVDFLEKPIGSEKLLITLSNALRLARLEKEAADRAKKSVRDLEMIGSSGKMKHLEGLIRRAAPSNARVLITGERGTGKELVARAVHGASKRSTGPFVKLNCAAIPQELIESELFGHEKGAFTGATKERPGKFELAHGGTLFLDEIGDLAGPAQAKVLRALQEGEIERVGGSETLKVDVRVLAATNKDLSGEIARHQFRADLFDRLNVIPIELPPLRERQGRHSRAHARVRRARVQRQRPPRTKLTDAAQALLIQHDWPGNVRELKNLVERLCILAEPRAGAGVAVIDENEVRAALPHLKVTRVRLERGRALKDQLLSAEREIIQAALEANEGAMAAAARRLGLERSHLYKKVPAARHRAPARPPNADDHEGDEPEGDATTTRATKRCDRVGAGGTEERCTLERGCWPSRSCPARRCCSRRTSRPRTAEKRPRPPGSDSDNEAPPPPPRANGPRERSTEPDVVTTDPVTGADTTRPSKKFYPLDWVNGIGVYAHYLFCFTPAMIAPLRGARDRPQQLRRGAPVPASLHALRRGHLARLLLVRAERRQLARGGRRLDRQPRHPFRAVRQAQHALRRRVDHRPLRVQRLARASRWRRPRHRRGVRRRATPTNDSNYRSARRRTRGSTKPAIPISPNRRSARSSSINPARMRSCRRPRTARATTPRRTRTASEPRSPSWGS